MAANLRKRRAPNVGGPPPSSTDICASEVLVWNRTRAVSERHAAEHNTRVLGDDFDALAQANVVFMCMPTSDEVRAMYRPMAAWYRAPARDALRRKHGPMPPTSAALFAWASFNAVTTEFLVDQGAAARV